ncbi:MAG: 23S rRNA (pseudouridine(1915)-N(3))-methyltransferase RlmH [Alphaproteobacteria bacterium]|nr:23S rRNA (pseudouridine(1915)-N(3))-methyltransferase RlmH [Alphaproteobacteria bacterium SS10]
MNITIAAIGKARAGPERALYEHYAERMRWPLTLKESDLKKPIEPVDKRRAAEAELLSASLPSGAVVIALDERGRELGSRDFASKLANWRDGGRADIALIIGGADGLDPVLKAKADLIWSFGKATWPHMLVRAMLAEQIYRAQTILDGHPYHRD